MKRFIRAFFFLFCFGSTLFAQTPIPGNYWGLLGRNITPLSLTKWGLSFPNSLGIFDSLDILSPYFKLNGSLTGSMMFADSVYWNSKLNQKVNYLDSTITFFTPTQALGKVSYSDTASTLVSSASKTGFLKYSDWTLFNSKQPAGTYLVPSDSTSLRNYSNALYQPKLTIGNLSANAPLTQTGGTGAVIGSGVTVSADTTVLATHSYVNNRAAGLFEYDSNGDLEPATATVYDAFFTTDANGDIEPKP